MEEGPLGGIADAVPPLPLADSPLMEEGRRAIMACVTGACGTTVAEALEVQARQAAEFLAGPACLRGVVGAEFVKTTRI